MPDIRPAMPSNHLATAEMPSNRLATTKQLPSRLQDAVCVIYGIIIHQYVHGQIKVLDMYMN